MKRTVSVITTAYNAEKFIAVAVNSVFSQVITDNDLFLEYVIVDDKSPDNSVQIIKKFIEHWKETHNGNMPNNFSLNVYTTEHNLGCGGARKYGIEHAHGDYFMFLDADDYYLNSNFIQSAVDKLESTNSDIVEYGLLYNNENGKQSPSVVDKEITITDPEKALVSLYKNNILKFHVWTKIIRREIIEQFPYSEQRTFEDVITIPIWISLCNKITIVPSIEINYRATQNSIIREKILDTRLGTVKAIAANFERFKKWRNVLIAMYTRAMIDLTAVLDNKTSENPGFDEMSTLNTYMLSYIMPKEYKSLTYNIENEENRENGEN